MRRSLFLPGVLGLGLLTACPAPSSSGDGPPAATPVPTPVPTSVPGDSGVSTPTPLPGASTAVEGSVTVEGSTGLSSPVLQSRPRRRMTIFQLDDAIRRASGGIGWTEVRGGKEVNLFDDLAATLGRPDYLERTREDLNASMIFEKFLGDASRSVCSTLVEKERSSAQDSRVLMVYVDPKDTLASNPEGVDANLRYLLLRYHSRRIEQGSLELNPWSWLFESTVQVTGDPALGWRAVCVGLMMHPDFFSY